METLRTIVRFFIIAVAVALLAFLSISLFKLIPLGIEQLASATVSLGQRTSLTATTTTASTTERTAQPVPVTPNGLNGVYNPNGDLVVLEKPATTTTSTAAPVTTRPTTTGGRTYTYYPPTYTPTYTLSGRKNLKITFTSLGVIQNGQFVSTNSFTTNDTVSMRFLISNNEDTPTGTWSMRVDMPATGGADKVKLLTNLDSIPGQSSYSGEVRFDGIDLSQGTPVIRVALDVYGQVTESNESDNNLAITLSNVTNNSYNNNNNCYNGSYYYNCNGNNNGYNNGNTNGNNCYNGSYYYNCNNGGYDTGYNNGNGNGTPNLYITSLEVGRLVNGSFYAQTTFNYGEQVAIRAHIRNNGGFTNSSYATRLNVYDANNFSRDISNGTEPALSGNSEATVTYQIDNLTRGSNRLTFYADSSNNISESNEGDNSTQVTVQVY